MTRANSLFVLALALAAAPSIASAGSEALALGADKAFMSAAFSSPLPMPSAAEWKVRMPLPTAQVTPSMGWFSLTVLAQFGGDPVGAAAQVGDIDLAALLNKQLKSPLKYSLGGKDVWVSGAFDRQQNAYVSILVSGSEPVFFNVKGLLDKEETVTAGSAIPWFARASRPGWKKDFHAKKTASRPKNISTGRGMNGCASPTRKRRIWLRQR